MNGTKDIIPRRILEVEKDNYDLCKLAPGEVAYKDIARVEAMARKSSRFFTREVFEKNIMPEQVTKEGEEGQEEEPKTVSEYELWKNKKEFEIRIRQDMLNQVLENYDQQRELYKEKQELIRLDREEKYRLWFKEKRDNSLTKKQETEALKLLEEEEARARRLESE